MSGLALACAANSGRRRIAPVLGEQRLDRLLCHRVDPNLVGRVLEVDADLRALRERLAEIADLARAGTSSPWDQKVTMPAGGHPARAEALATLGRVVHEKFVDDEVGHLLERLRPVEESLEYDSDDASLIRVTRRDWEKQRRVPTELRVELTRAAALGNQVWIEARATNDFAKFLPALQRNLELKRRYVECFEWEDSPYTAAPRRLRAAHADDRGDRGIRDDPPRARRARARGASRRRVVPAPAVSGRRTGELLQAHPRDARSRGWVVSPRPDRAPVLHLVLDGETCA